MPFRLCSAFLFRLGGGYCNSIVAEQIENNRLSNYFGEYIPFPVAVWDAFIGAFYRRPELNTPLWTIKYEFFGVIMDYIIIRLLPDKKKKWIYPIVGILLYCITRDLYWIAVFLGAVLFDWLFNPYFKHKLSRITAISLKIITAVLAVMVVFGVYATYFRLMLALVLCIVIAEDKTFQQICSNKVVLNLSKYTFAIYAVHWPIICSFSCFLFLKFTSNFLRIICCVVSVLFMVIVGYLMECANKNIATMFRHVKIRNE